MATRAYLQKTTTSAYTVIRTEERVLIIRNSDAKTIFGCDTSEREKVFDVVTCLRRFGLHDESAAVGEVLR